ncbi:probable ethanolamine kinase [Sycon ciliatum]|uniref:probable ethanolamine kinase n=1 Tax=Sycon ciliatum TaxID=27933 RepID=UPI0031F672A9
MDVKEIKLTVNSEESVLDLIRLVRPEWKSDDSLAIRVFQGGVANRLYGVLADGNSVARTLLVKVFGEGSDLLIDRRKEREHIELLWRHGHAEPLCATFDNGFVYGYIVGRPLTVTSARLPHVFPKIARQLARVHSVPKPDGLLNPEPAILRNLVHWLDLVPETFSKADVHQRVDAILQSRSVLKAEVKALVDRLQSLNSPVVFGHNDVRPENILELDDNPDQVAFIDHEYAGWNYRCFDLGNLFCKYCGVVEHMDSSLFPSHAEQESFLQVYSTEAAALQSKGDHDVATLYNEASLGALASNMQWAIWCLVQAEHSLMEFDYVDYAGNLLAEYYRQKALR